MIYETKGLSLEQVDELYTVISQARKSKTFEPQVAYQDVDPNTHRHMSLSEIGAEHARKRSVQHDETLASEKL
jgi:SP family sugar:H+ symporter-like MFS transporter